VALRDSREIAPLIFFGRIVEVVSLFKSTDEHELLFTVLLNRYDCGSHAAFGHFGNLDRLFKLIPIIKFELIALFNKSLIGKLESVVVELV
jgi:hypothetical protein